MSDEVWWARRINGLGVQVSKLKSFPWTGTTVFDVLQWSDMEGPLIDDGEIIPIRPLRIERVEVKNDR